jgi:hypothetical protein
LKAEHRDDRSRGGRHPALQIFAVRDDVAAIGQVADDRLGIAACDQEAKYPLGPWARDGTRMADPPIGAGSLPQLGGFTARSA